MSIMKEYQDMPITCVEIESDLKGILDQITINGQGRGNPDNELTIIQRREGAGQRGIFL